jgi:hypothetical protein
MVGICFLKKGMPKLAVEWFEKGLQSPGRDEEEYASLRTYLADAFQALDQPDKAHEVLMEGMFSASEVTALSKLSALIVLVTRAFRRGGSGLTAAQRAEVLNTLKASTDCLTLGRVEELDACIRRLERAVRLLEPN